jgi:alpha-beta hydrolase superfamily lysophospholipase
LKPPFQQLRRLENFLENSGEVYMIKGSTILLGILALLISSPSMGLPVNLKTKLLDAPAIEVNYLEDFVHGKVHDGTYEGAYAVEGNSRQEIQASDLNRFRVPFSQYYLNVSPNIDISVVESQSPGDGPVVVFVLGNSWRVRELLKEKGDPSNDGDANDVVREMLSYGWHVVLFDYPGYGASSGNANENNLVKATQTVISHVSQSFHRPIFVIGHSLGATVALDSVARLSEQEQKTEIRAVISASAFANLIDETLFQMNQLTRGLVPQSALDNLEDKYDLRNTVSRIRVPTLVLHAGIDETVPVDMSYQLFVAMPQNPNKAIKIIEGAKHDEILRRQNPNFSQTWQAIKTFVSGH